MKMQKADGRLIESVCLDASVQQVWVTTTTTPLCYDHVSTVLVCWAVCKGGWMWSKVRRSTTVNCSQTRKGMGVWLGVALSYGYDTARKKSRTQTDIQIRSTPPPKTQWFVFVLFFKVIEKCPSLQRRQQQGRVTLSPEIQIWPYVPLISRKVPCFYSEKCTTVQRRVVSSDTVCLGCLFFCFFCSFVFFFVFHWLPPRCRKAVRCRTECPWSRLRPALSQTVFAGLGWKCLLKVKKRVSSIASYGRVSVGHKGIKVPKCDLWICTYLHE